MRQTTAFAPCVPEKASHDRVLETSTKEIDQLSPHDGKCKPLPGQFFGSGHLIVGHRVPPIKQEHLMDVNFDRTYLRTFAAKAGSIAKMFERFHSPEVRSDQGADRTAVCGVICVAAYVFVNRTSVKACAATDAIQPLPLFFLSE